MIDSSLIKSVIVSSFSSIAVSSIDINGSTVAVPSVDTGAVVLLGDSFAVRRKEFIGEMTEPLKEPVKRDGLSRPRVLLDVKHRYY